MSTFDKKAYLKKYRNDPINKARARAQQHRYVRSAHGKAVRLRLRTQRSSKIRDGRSYSPEYQHAHSQKVHAKLNKRAWWLMRDYRLTISNWEAIFDGQGRCCAVCDATFASRWSVDHEHASSRIRGIVCTRCNVTIAKLGDIFYEIRKRSSEFLKYIALPHRDVLSSLGIPADRQRYNLYQWRRGDYSAWDALFDFQGRRCAICSIETPPTSGWGKGWNLDHEHASGQVRGILCGRCNLLLGRLGDTRNEVENRVSRILIHADNVVLLSNNWERMSLGRGLRYGDESPIPYPES